MHEPFMQAAFTQAQLGRGVTAPNPAVGAVAVLDGNIIAQAVTAPNPEVSHAEQLLLKALPANCSNMTLYVTLEPCNHWGRTPPCTAGIILSGFKQVVYAYRDPNPLVSKNNTPDLLAEQGIDVVHYPLPEIDAFYASYAFWLKTGRPWVTLKMAQTFDGKIAGKNSVRVQLSNAACAEATHKARLHTDVILTTARTIAQDNPLLNARVGHQVISKPIAVLEGQKRLFSAAEIHKTAKKIHRYHAMSLFDVLCDLGRLGYHDVWVEAGSQLFNALHREQLVQRTILYLVPNSLGDEALSLYQDANMLSGAQKITWNVLDDNLSVVFDW